MFNGLTWTFSGGIFGKLVLIEGMYIFNLTQKSLLLTDIQTFRHLSKQALTFIQASETFIG
jgi:hypothetical protein